ncbi:branched-chain amino acid ABC transporter permease [Thermospira aquatica]|uniref:Branched-chain amino acid ABC transporter permease n=1 Tax=Thermospira aquatica TaxID=2828656 RepID=A0AAX3BBQ5_9SPIR|nr:branched-chain amino acid ABC transporter permease [Thermospira aquatica]URA09752.1 branched-chain amino acid ABC transporter permease [Thermospira aquatica]
MLNFLSLLVIYIEIYAILALSLNLIAGYTGLLSLCHAAFFAIGAYTTAIGMTMGGWNFWFSLFVSGILASMLGLVVGLPTLRLKGDYLAIATLGFGEVVKNIIINWDSLTRGPNGINGVPTPEMFGLKFGYDTPFAYVLLYALFVAGTYFVIRWVVHSRFGRALEAIREDEIAVGAMGINAVKYKVVAFMMGAFFAGIAGSLWAVYNQSVAPQTFDFMLSVLVLCMVVLGGLGNSLGAILGALVIVILSELPRLTGLTSLIPAQFNQMFFGLLLILVMIFRPQGVLGRKRISYETEVARILERRSS